MRAWLAIALLAGCDQVFLGAEPLTPEEISLLPFDPPVPLIATPQEEDRGTMTDDLLELYFHREQKIWRATRASVDAPFDEPTVVISGADEIIRACIAGDGNQIYVSKVVNNTATMYAAMRRDDGWSELVNENIAARQDQYCGWESADKRTLLMTIDFDVVRVERASDGTLPVTRLEDFSTPAREVAVSANADASLVVFDRQSNGDSELFQATLQGSTYAVRKLTELDFQLRVGSPWLSKDARTIVFTYENDLWMATR